MDSSPSDLRGHSVQLRLATWTSVIGSFLTDFVFVLFIFYIADRFKLQFPIWLPLLGFVAFWLLQMVLLKRTLGNWVWHIRLCKSQHDSKFRKLFGGRFRTDLEPGKEGSIRSWLGTTIIVFLFVGTLHNEYFSSPITERARTWKLSAALPDPTLNEEWQTLPFYYATGAWPQTFQGNAVFMSLPYKKGPPKQFTTKVVARWKMPDIFLEIEGPRTETDRESFEKIQSCLKTRFSCFELREKVLSRHWQEVKESFSPEDFELKVFEIDNPALKDAEKAKGIYLKAFNSSQVQERYIFINSEGTHQTLILHRKQSDDGDYASDLLRASVRTFRLNHTLRPALALANRELANVNLESVKTQATDPFQYVDSIANVQMKLLSKISVSPQSKDAYYHLGGTAYLLSAQAVKAQSAASSISTARFLLEVNEWATVAKPLIRSAYLYLKDVDPDSAYIAKLEQLWEETKLLIKDE